AAATVRARVGRWSCALVLVSILSGSISAAAIRESTSRTTSAITSATPRSCAPPPGAVLGIRGSTGDESARVARDLTRGGGHREPLRDPNPRGRRPSLGARLG